MLGVNAQRKALMVVGATGAFLDKEYSEVEPFVEEILNLSPELREGLYNLTMEFFKSKQKETKMMTEQLEEILKVESSESSSEEQNPLSDVLKIFDN